MSIFSRLAPAFLCVSLLCGYVGAKTIVTVDGLAISDAIFEPIKQQNPSFSYDSLSEVQKTQALDELINMVVAANAAKKEGLDKNEEYRMAVIQLMSQLWLKKQVDSLSKTVQVTISEAQNYYNNNKEQFVVQNATFRHILVSKEDEAKNIISQIGKVPKTKTEDKISELAGKYSIDESSKSNGGLIDNVSMSGLDRDFAQELGKMSVNTYTKTPVKTRYGYHIIYLKKIDKPVTQTFDKVRDQLIQAMKQQKMQGIIQEKVKKLRDSANIVYGG